MDAQKSLPCAKGGIADTHPRNVNAPGTRRIGVDAPYVLAHAEP